MSAQVAGAGCRARDEARESAVFLGRPARGLAPRSSTRCLRRRRASRHTAAPGRHLGGFPLPDPQAYARSYRHAHAAPARLAQFTCALPEHLRELPTAHVGHPGCFATAILLASVPAARRRPRRTDAVRERRHRQHRLAGANPCQARIIRCVTAISTATARSSIGSARAGSHGVCARGSAGGRALCLRAPFRTVRARHTRDAAWPSSPARSHPGAAGGAARVLTRTRRFVRVGTPKRRASRTVATSNSRTCRGRSRAATVAVLCAIRQSQQRCRRRRHAMDEPDVGLPETAGLTAPAPGWT